MTFVHPTNGYIEKGGTGFSWLWMLLFGAVFLAVKGCWRHVSIYLVLVPTTLGLAWLIYPFFARRLVDKAYLRQGWRPAQPN